MFHYLSNQMTSVSNKRGNISNEKIKPTSVDTLIDLDTDYITWMIHLGIYRKSNKVFVLYQRRMNLHLK